MLHAARVLSPSTPAAYQQVDTAPPAIVRPTATSDDPVQIEVDPARASLTELVRLAHLAVSVSASAPLLAVPVCTGCWQPSRRVRLYFDTVPVQHPAQTGSAVARSTVAGATVPATAAAVELANETLAQLLQTTRLQLRLPDRAALAARILQQYARALDRSRRPQTAAAFRRMVQITAEAGHREAAAQLPMVRANVPQMPTDCLLHWISALRAAHQTAEGATHPWLKHTEAAARRRWMQHDLTLDSVRIYFLQMQAQCDAQHATGLAATARKIAETLPTAQQEHHLDARLNDNIYGRVFETRLTAQLIASPLAGSLECTQRLAGALLQALSTLPPQVKSLVVKELCATLVSEPRFWFDRVPALRRFITAAPGEQKKRALVDWLRTPPASAYDCMAIALCACQLSLALKVNAPEFAPWMSAANLNYAQAVQPASRRLKNMTQALLRAEGGILLLHQRPAFSHPAMRPGVRATLQHRPDLDSRSLTTRRALAHGLPYASGVSGSTNILLHCAAFFRKDGLALDIRHLLLVAMMLLNGGHSLHEVLWIAHQLDRPLKLGLALSSAAPEEFISDYDRFIDLFDDTDRQVIERAVAAAWNDTIDYARMPVGVLLNG